MLLSDLILHSEKQVPSLRFALTVADLAPLTDPAHPVHPNELGGIDKICQGLRVDPTIGLYSDEADENSIGKKTDGVEFSARRKAFGSNTLAIEGPHVTVPNITFFILGVHLICSLTFLASKRYYNPEDSSRSGQVRNGAIFIGLLLASIAGIHGVVTLSFLLDSRSAKKMEEARKREGSGQRGVAVVLRDACEQQVDVDEIQVGDILMLLPGGDVPVDGIVLKSHGLACDEFGAVSEPEVKPTRDLHEGGHLISGTTVLSGSGSMLVTAVGSNLVANKARDSEDGRGPRERMMVRHAPKTCVAMTMTLFIVSFSRYFIMSIPNGSLPPVRDILADLSKIAVQISGIILDSSADSLLMCGLCLAAYVFVQLRKRMSVTEVLFKEYRRMLAIGVALLCLAVSKNILETSMGTIFQKTPTDATTLVYNRAQQRTLASYVTGILLFCL